MGLLLFVAAVAIVVARPLVWFLWRSRPRPGAANMVLVWHAVGEPGKETTMGALRSAGLSAHVVDSGGYYPGVRGGSAAGYRYEIWVRTRDEERAREVLGLATARPSSFA